MILSRKQILKAALERDNKISLLELRANEAEKLSFIINGKEESKRYFSESCELRLAVRNLKSQPINVYGAKFYVTGNEIYSLNPEVKLEKLLLMYTSVCIT